MEKLQYTFMTDTLVKMLFVRHQHLLSILDFVLLSNEEYHSEFMALEVT